jgi:hypothetical protein
MRAEGIVRQVLGDVESGIHRAREDAVTAAVLALVRGGRIGLAALGRAIANRSYKHGIKRIDRLLGNEILTKELDSIYAAIARYVLRGMKRPVVLVDWTQSGETTCTLTAAVPIQGRAITIYSVTCRASRYTSRALERRFLLALRTILGGDRTPILVGDAGFRGPWIRQIATMGWDFVARIRGRTHVQRVEETQWQRWNSLIPLARRKARSLGRYRFVKAGSFEANLVIFDGRSRRARLPSSPVKHGSTRAKHGSNAAREPWFLATSLPLPAAEIVKIYASRMQIELTFRDLKSHRFGWGFEDARCRSTSRIAAQILLAALASLVCMLVGIAAEAAGLHKSYQANTITKRRVLSLVALGCAVIRTGDTRELPTAVVRDYAPFVGIP